MRIRNEYRDQFMKSKQIKCNKSESEMNNKFNSYNMSSKGKS